VVSSYVRLIPEYLISLTLRERFICQALICQAEIRDANGVYVTAIIIMSNRVA